MAQSAPQPSGPEAIDKESDGQGASKKKKEEKAGCFRCKKPGHYIDDCPTPFCDICESIHHITSACHLLNAPKPTAILHGYANEGLMFFELACGVFKAKAENPKLAKVTVEGITLTIPEIIEQLKKIVPSEKFVWEVFHFKDNIYRVKLPSKLEVQRLKNFGTYICTDKEACLAFDSWSSVEEPLHMLPEVWVRVSGLPSDVRSDYLTLWGVGTLFGKTLDVDMAYTRKNKVLRTKIGCLDHRLIPADSDMFIRRGFYKLHFEVELEDESHEVTMVEANNGSDGNNGDNQGEEKNGDAHDMDMDGRDKGIEGASKGNDQVGSNSNKGGDVMQEQCDFLEDTQFGSVDVKCVSPGNQSVVKKLSCSVPILLHTSNSNYLAQNDKLCTFSDVDMLNRVATPGLVSTGIGALSWQPATGQDLPAAAPGTHGACGGPPAGRQLAAASAVATPRDTSGAADLPNAAGKLLAGSLQAVASGRAVAEAGLSAPGRSTSPVAVKHIAPQKIQPVAVSQPELRALREVNQMPMIGAMQDGLAVQHSARVLGVPDGECLANNLNDLNFGVSQRFDLNWSSDSVHDMHICDNVGVGSGGSLEQSKGRTTADVLAMAKGVGLCATKEAMGVASSSVHVGKP
jgi:hypothetical protein